MRVTIHINPNSFNIFVFVVFKEQDLLLLQTSPKKQTAREVNISMI